MYQMAVTSSSLYGFHHKLPIQFSCFPLESCIGEKLYYGREGENKDQVTLMAASSTLQVFTAGKAYIIKEVKKNMQENVVFVLKPDHLLL